MEAETGRHKTQSRCMWRHHISITKSSFMHLKRVNLWKLFIYCQYMKTLLYLSVI